MRTKVTNPMIVLLLTIFWTSSWSLVMADGPQNILAFPGAEGAGAMTPGGRGGQVIEVTNLNDSGPGSLRKAVKAKGPRVVIFRVGGTIELDSKLVIRNPYLTIAGQTAPGGGITIKDEPVVIVTHDVIIRYIRFRPGESGSTSPEDTDGLAIVNEPDDANDTDGMVHDIIIDHCSVSWALDENISLWNFKPKISQIENVTIQWSIISEGISHSKGLLMGQHSNNISIHHNLFAHNTDRHPYIKGGAVEFVNNVLYNGYVLTTVGGATEDIPATILNYIGNYEIRGANSSKRNMIIITPQPGNFERNHQIYVQGNIGTYRRDDQQDDWLVVNQGWGRNLADRSWQILTPHPFPGMPVTIQDYMTAYNEVLAGAGASLVRDAVDERIVNDVKNQTGEIIDHPSDVGGYPVIANGTPSQDLDHDGMPDSWEQKVGLNPQNASDNIGDLDGDGYTNIEEYLNGTEITAQVQYTVFLPIISNYSSSASGETETRTLPAIADAHVKSGAYADDNFGNATTLQFKKNTNPDKTRKAYLKFEINSLSSATSAKLRIYGRISEESQTLSIYPVLDDSWIETELTWNNAPSYDQKALDSLTVDNNSDTWWELDVTDFVQNEIAGRENTVSFVLFSPNEGGPLMSANSREHSTNPPQLAITVSE